MRTLMLLALAVALFAACADEPAQDDATFTDPAWLTDRPENAHPYADDTLARFSRLVESDGWRDAAWNAQGTLEATHERTGLAFVLIPAGSFMMGSDCGHAFEKPIHEVRVPAFLICRTECTQRAWFRIGGLAEPVFKGENLPIENVSWVDASAWCSRARLRLPSSAEWEYACRAGNTGRWCFGDEEELLREYAWYIVNSGSTQFPWDASFVSSKPRNELGLTTHPVAKLAANAFGLYDVHGNVMEWCEDMSHDSYVGAPLDGSAWVTVGDDHRVIRGSAFYWEAYYARSSFFSGPEATARSSRSGLRPAASLPE
jgi:formylglycine-generating enzyme required for sulfatase activity